MRKLFGMLVAAMVMLMMLPVSTAGATPPADVEIAVEENLAIPGSFVASGSAVDVGLLCATGTTETIDGGSAGNGPWGFKIKAVKLFTCDDLSGTFLVKLEARRIFDDPDVLTTFNWTVLDGTGDYAGLHGSGKGVGVAPLGDYDILDLYSGRMHIN